MDSFQKQPNEQFTIEIDFSRRLGTGETISSYDIDAIDYDTSTDVKTTIVDSDTNDTESVYITVKAGTNGSKYKFTVLTTTSSSNIYEKDLLMKVYDN